MKVRCERCESPLDATDLRCSVCALPLPRALERVERPRARIVRCGNCGAAVGYDPKVKAPRCAFCGEVRDLSVREDPVEIPEGYLPFRVHPSDAADALVEWLGSGGFFRPSDLATASALEALTPLWWVGWVIAARVVVSWMALSDEGARKARWAPHSGRKRVRFDDVIIGASRGLSEEETVALAEGYDLSEIDPQPAPVPGAVIEAFEMHRSAARAAIRRGIDALCARAAQRWVPGRVVRNLRVSTMVRRLRSRSLAFPAYVLAYQYKGKTYRVVIHGQDPGVVLGERPIAWGKVFLVAAGVAGLIALLAALLAST